MVQLLQGVVKALREQGLLPRVIAGSSVGSIGGAATLSTSDVGGDHLAASKYCHPFSVW